MRFNVGSATLSRRLHMDTKTKLTLIIINGQTIMAHLPADDNGKVKADFSAIRDVVGIPIDGSLHRLPGR